MSPFVCICVLVNTLSRLSLSSLSLVKLHSLLKKRWKEEAPPRTQIPTPHMHNAGKQGIGLTWSPESATFTGAPPHYGSAYVVSQALKKIWVNALLTHR